MAISKQQPGDYSPQQEKSSTSPGPKTAQGKARSKWNALKHGLLAKEVVLLGEDRNKFYLLLARLRDYYQPVGAPEEIEVEKMAAIYWRQGRAIRCEGGAIRENTDNFEWRQEIEREEELSLPKLQLKLAAVQTLAGGDPCVDKGEPSTLKTWADRVLALHEARRTLHRSSKGLDYLIQIVGSYCRASPATVAHLHTILSGLVTSSLGRYLSCRKPVGYKPRVGFEEGLRQTVAWYCSQPDAASIGQRRSRLGWLRR